MLELLVAAMFALTVTLFAISARRIAVEVHAKTGSTWTRRRAFTG